MQVRVYRSSLKTLRLIACVFLASSSLMSCVKTTEPTGERFKLEVIPCDSLPTNFDSTFYQHDPAFLDTTMLDSILTTLLNAGFAIKDAWYPQTVFMCLIPIKAGIELVIRLAQQDTVIHRYDFHTYNGFPWCCVRYWRHYYDFQ